MEKDIFNHRDNIYDGKKRYNQGKIANCSYMSVVRSLKLILTTGIFYP